MGELSQWQLIAAWVGLVAALVAVLLGGALLRALWRTSTVTHWCQKVTQPGKRCGAVLVHEQHLGAVNVWRCAVGHAWITRPGSAELRRWPAADLTARVVSLPEDAPPVMMGIDP